MPKPISVTDLNSNYEENIQRWALELSRSSRRLKTFEALYAGRKQSKAVSEIANIAGLPEQAVRDEGHKLRALGLCGHEKAEGERTFLYTRLPHISSIRNRISRLARNPSRIAKLPTKRRPTPTNAAIASFSKRQPKSSIRSGRAAKPSTPTAELRIVFLAANPDGDLRTDIEMRDIQSALRRTLFRDKVTLKHIPAARLSDLLAELNDFRPTIVHFSGHGGDEAVVFENEVARHGGVVIDYGLVANFIEFTDTPPKVLFLNACDTYEGAEVFLDFVEVVVAMLDSVDDAAAGYFSTQFYSAVGSGQSVASALKQGKAVLKAGGFLDADLPIALARKDIKLDRYKLIG